MKKIIIIGASACLLAAVIAGFVVYSKLGDIIKVAVETYGPQITKTEVRLAGVKLSPFSGEGRISGLVIGNPKGYQTESAFKLNDVQIAVDLKSLTTDKIVIKHIIIDGPEITMEGGLKGSNLTRIQKNVESFMPKSTSKKAAAEPSGPQPKVEIGLFRVTNGKVNLSLRALKGKDMTVDLPKIELRDIGKGSGVTIGQAAKKMFGAVTSGAVKAGMKGTGLLKDGAKAVGEHAKSLLKGQGKDAASKLKGLFGK